jgi:hypothetical protein
VRRTATTPVEADSGRFHLPDGSRSAGSPWVWRGFLFMSFIALGLCLTFAAGSRIFYATAWAVITVGWFTLSMWLWRQHIRYDDAARRAPAPGRRSPQL